MYLLKSLISEFIVSDSMKRSLMRFQTLLLMGSMFACAAAAAGEFAVFKSSDQGRSWRRSDAGLPGQSRINAFGSLDATLFAGTDSGIYVSRDEARSWGPATGVAMSSGRILSLAALGTKMFAGTDGRGMLVSVDQGESWTLDAAFSPKKVRCLLAHQGKLYAGTDAEGVFVSSANFQVWTALKPGLPVHAQVFDLAAVDGRIFAGLYSQGLYVWNEGENHWIKAGSVSPLALASSAGTLIAGHNPGGLYWSADLGGTWSKGTAKAVEVLASPLSREGGELSDHAPVWSMAGNEALVIAGASAGIYYSEDRGRTWTRARTGLPDESPGISFLVQRTFILAGTQLNL